MGEGDGQSHHKGDGQVEPVARLQQRSHNDTEQQIPRGKHRRCVCRRRLDQQGKAQQRRCEHRGLGGGVAVQVVRVEAHVPQKEQGCHNALGGPLQAHGGPPQRGPQRQPQNPDQDQGTVHREVDPIVPCPQAGRRQKHHSDDVVDLRGKNDRADDPQGEVVLSHRFPQELPADGFGRAQFIGRFGPKQAMDFMYHGVISLKSSRGHLPRHCVLCMFGRCPLSGVTG